MEVIRRVSGPNINDYPPAGEKLFENKICVLIQIKTWHYIICTLGGSILTNKPAIIEAKRFLFSLTSSESLIWLWRELTPALTCSIVIDFLL